MFDIKQPAPVLEAVTFNFDTSAFESMVLESDANITRSIDSYRSLMTEALTESAGVLNEDASLIMEQANENVGQKIMKMLNAIKDWLIKTVNSIILKIQTLVASNKKLMDKIKPTVQEKFTDGGLKGFKVETYKYTLDAVDINAFVVQFESEQVDAALSIKSGFEGNQMSERLANQLKQLKEMSNDKIAIKCAEMANIKVGNAKDIPLTARKLLRGGGELQTFSFSMDFFNVIEKFGDLKDSIQKTFKTMTHQVDQISAEFKASVKDVSVENAEDKAYQSKLIEAFNAKRRLLSGMLSTAVLLNNLKLQASVEQMNTAKKICVQAYNHKAVQEGAVVEPYAPYLDIE